MDRDEKKQERNFELRSEKVRSIVGQIPSSLVRYGITAIGFVLAALFAVAYFLPYKRVYAGVATVYAVESGRSSDSIQVAILLKFEHKRLCGTSGEILRLESPRGVIAGQILQLSPRRDTLGRQEALCRFKTVDIRSVADRTVDFQVIQSTGNILQKILGDVGL